MVKFHFVCFVIVFICEETGDHLGSLFGQLGQPKIISGAIYAQLTFQEIPKHENVEFLVSPMTICSKVPGNESYALPGALGNIVCPLSQCFILKSR